MKRMAIVESNGHLSALPSLESFVSGEFIVLPEMEVYIVEVEVDLVAQIWEHRHDTFLRPDPAAGLIVGLEFDGRKMRLVSV